MFYTKLKSKFLKYLADLFFVQIIATLTSMPILIIWGMPLSIMSLLGNFLFTPIMILFLIISSFLFFTEIVGIPNQFFAVILDYTTEVIEFLLSFGSKKWLIATPFSSKLVIIFIPIISTIILLNNKIKFLFLKILIATLFIIITIGYLKFSNQIQFQSIFLDKENKLLLQCDENKNITLIDDGAFNKKQSIETFINFELTPFLIKKFGTLEINQLILNKSSIRSFQSALELFKTFQIKSIKVKINSKKLNEKGWRLFYRLKWKTLGENLKFEEISETTEKLTLQ